MSETQAIWFGVLFGAILVWFGLGVRLFRLLERDHAEVYARMGSPSLVANNTIRNNWLSLRFLVGGGYRELGDARVTRLCRFMRVFLVAYLLWLVGPFVWFWSRGG